MIVAVFGKVAERKEVIFDSSSVMTRSFHYRIMYFQNSAGIIGASAACRYMIVLMIPWITRIGEHMPFGVVKGWNYRKEGLL